MWFTGPHVPEIPEIGLFGDVFPSPQTTVTVSFEWKLVKLPETVTVSTPHLGMILFMDVIHIWLVIAEAFGSGKVKIPIRSNTETIEITVNFTAANPSYIQLLEEYTPFVISTIGIIRLNPWNLDRYRS